MLPTHNKEYKKWLQGRKWRNLRVLKLSNTPWCEDCLMAHKRTPATEVHHKNRVLSFPSRQEREAAMYDYNNLASLCHECHKKRHDKRQVKKNRAKLEENKMAAFIAKYSR